MPFYHNLLFLIPILTEPIFIFVGLIMYKFPSKNINSLYGYRTTRFMDNQKNWDFAQIYSAKKTIIYGIIYTLTCLLGLVFNPHELISFLITMLFLVLTVVFLIVNVEKAIKNNQKQLMSNYSALATVSTNHTQSIKTTRPFLPLTI